MNFEISKSEHPHGKGYGNGEILPVFQLVFSVADDVFAIELWTVNAGAHHLNLSPTFSPQVIDWLLAHPKPRVAGAVY